MKREIQIQPDQVVGQAGHTARRRIVRLSPRLRSWICSIVAAFGIFGGLSSLFIGLVLIVIHGLLNADRIFDRIGTGLLIVAIPMILIGSIFLDWINQDK
jgi:hypothetical protein